MTVTRVVRVPWYLAVVFAILSVTTPPGVLYAAVRISDNKAQAAIRQSELADCAGLLLELRIYDENRPTTPAGIELRKGKELRYSTLGCEPKRR